MARKFKIQLRRDTAANWTSTNPTLASGETGVETDTGRFKFGDGATAWNSLAYSGETGGAPTGAAGGVLSGTYPNPGFAVDMATQAELDGHTHTAGFVPVGGIIMWSGTIASIPATWALCDGTLNSPGPDLRERFIVGASADDAGVAKTNLTGSLTVSGGAITHDHSASGTALSAHSLSTSVALSAHSGAAVSAHANAAVSAHSLSTSVALSAHANAAVSAHSGTAVSAHTLSTNVALSAHALGTNVAIANHATSGFRTSASGTAAAVSAATHTITQPAVDAHTITQPAITDHSITQPSAHTITQPDAHSITQPVVGDHSVTQPDAHSITQPDAHSITQPVVGAHSITQPTIASTSAPQPYYALAFIQRMS